MSRPARSSVQQISSTVLSCDEINYTVSIKQNPCSKETHKQILHKVTGIFKPGLNAILGATGSGKTSLLDVLAMRKDPAGLDGHILVNGQLMPSNFKCMSGYVPQDDIVLGTLTVRENIYFSAKLRLPSSISEKQRWEMVDDVVEELGLSHVANMKVGNQMIRGISGGERKRTCIGMELVTAPKVLYLDEPTTGLDSSTAGSVIALLHRLSKKGRTIIFSIHQPRFSIFKMFDRMMLLARGRVMFQGPAMDVLPYFTDIGYVCEMHDNPADFILDVINGDISPVNADDNGITNESQGYTNVSYVDETDITEEPRKKSDNRVMTQISYLSQASRTQDELSVDREALAKVNAQKYKDSRWNQELQAEVDPIFEEFKKSGKAHDKRKDDKDIQYNLTFFQQLFTLSRRTFLNLRRNPFASVMQLGVILFFALLVGVIYFDQENSLTTGIQNRVGAFFFLVTNQMFMNLSALELFLSDRLMFMHENSTGFYRVSVFFICKICFDLVPMRIIPVTIFSTIVFFMMDLRFTVAKFFTFMLNLVLTAMTGASFCFMYSSLFDIFAVVNLLTALTFVLMMIFGGFIVNVNDIWVGLRWLRYLSVFRYSLNTLCILELEDLVLCEPHPLNDTLEICDDEVGNRYLETNDIAYETTWDLWQNPLAVFCIMSGVLVITYLRLLTMNKYK